MRTFLPSTSSTSVATALCVVAACLASGCDTVEPVESSKLVVEGFFDAEKPVPAVRLWQTRPIDAPYDVRDSSTLAVGADVELHLDGQRVPFRPVPDRTGWYEPAMLVDVVVPSGSAFSLSVQWQDQRASAAGRVPPRVSIDSVRVDVPEEPIRAVIFDSLFIDPSVVDSLAFDSLQTGAHQGFAYPVEVTFWWMADDSGEADSLHWVRTLLRPDVEASGPLEDFFLRPEQVQREVSAAAGTGRLRRWVGVYGVPVPTDTAPLPPHSLTVALIRSHEDYAQFASSRNDPERREPVSNVEGALGIVAGIAVDSIRVWVE